MPGFQVPGDIALNASGTDILLQTDPLQAVLQRIKNGFPIFKGTWRYDRNKGITYIDDVLVKGPNLPLIRTIFANWFLGVRGVTEVLSLTLDLGTDRTLFVTFRVRCDNGQILDSVIQSGV